MSDTQRVINVIRQAVDQMTGTQVNYIPATVHEVQATPEFVYAGVSLLLATVTPSGGDGMFASAYAWGEELIEDIIVPSGQYIDTGDYIVVATNDDGKSWVDRKLPTTLYSMVVTDDGRGRIGVGDGQDADFNWGNDGDMLLSGGSGAPMRWGTQIPKHARYSKSAPQTIADSTATELSFDVVDFDTDSIEDVTGGITQFIPNRAGYWEISANAIWETVDTSASISIIFNGSTVISSGFTHVNTVYDFNGITDYITISVSQDSASSIDVTADSWVYLKWIGPNT